MSKGSSKSLSKDMFCMRKKGCISNRWHVWCFRWEEQVDDSLLEQQRAAYAVQGVDEFEPVQAANKKKRKKDEYTNGEEVGHAPHFPIPKSR